MRELNKEEIQKNQVNTISQYYILDYLKQNLNINEFKIYLVNRNNIKVVDTTGDYLYFSCDNNTREIIYSEKSKEYEKDMEL